MTERWRLVNGAELFDMEADPGQLQDVAAANAAVVEQLRGDYETWWERIAERFDERIPIVIGAAEEPETRITAHDWHNDDIAQIPWNQEQVQASPQANGYWAVEVARAGAYEFELYQRDRPAGYPVEASRARLKVGDVEVEAAVPAGAASVRLTAELAAGRAQMQTWFSASHGAGRGAFYVYARRLD
jgi:hypothetical protein